MLAWLGAWGYGNSDGGRAWLRERAEKAVRTRLPGAQVGGARLDLLLRASVGPLVAPSPRPGAPPLLRAERVLVRPRLAALLAGRVEAASIRLEHVRLAPGPGGEDLRRLLERPGPRPAAGPGAPEGAALPRVAMRDLVFRWGDAGHGVDLGPFDVDVDVRRTPDGPAGSLRLVLPGGGQVEAHLSPAGGETEVEASGRLSLHEDLPEALASRLPFSFPAGSVALRGTARLAPGGGAVRADVELRASDVSIAGAHVGASPVGPLAIAAAGQVAWDGRTRTISLADGRLSLGEADVAAVAVAGEVSLRGDRPFRLTATARAVPWLALVEALPADLGPPPTAPPLSGALSAEARISGTLARRSEWDVSVDLDLDDLRRAARAAPPTWLAGPFEWKPIDPAPGEPPRRILVGPGNPAFLPYAEAPHHLVRAITASEDAGFFGHRGFDFREIANAIAERGRVRGASTITQQLAKNLFLSPERTLARKVREALGTIALEATLSKARLMEIYLNVAEWGPGVYGAGEAARFWFGKDPRDLTPRESAFLATVIPAPRRFHARLHRSGITPWWQARIDDVLRKMRVQNALTDEELAAALAEPLAPLGRLHGPGGDAGDVAPADALSAPERGEDDPAADRPGDPSPATPAR